MGAIRLPWNSCYTPKTIKNIPASFLKTTVWDKNDFFNLTVDATDTELKSGNFMDVIMTMAPRYPKDVGEITDSYETTLLVKDVRLVGIKHVLTHSLIRKAEKKLKSVERITIYVKIVGCIFCDNPLSGNGLHYHKIDGVTN